MQHNRFFSALVLLTILSSSCASLSYKDYVVSPPTQVNPAIRDKGTAIRGSGNFKYETMTIRYNDGKMVTEVEIPILSSGQTLIVNHTKKGATQATPTISPPPTNTDKELHQAYLTRGLEIKKDSKPISLIESHKEAQDLALAGNYTLALRIIESVLNRYPQHPEFLRMKGSCLLSIGEKHAAIEVFEKAQSIDPDQQVNHLLKQLYKEIGGGSK